MANSCIPFFLLLLAAGSNNRTPPPPFSVTTPTLAPPSPPRANLASHSNIISSSTPTAARSPPHHPSPPLALTIHHEIPFFPVRRCAKHRPTCTCFTHVSLPTSFSSPFVNNQTQRLSLTSIDAQTRSPTSPPLYRQPTNPHVHLGRCRAPLSFPISSSTRQRHLLPFAIAHLRESPSLCNTSLSFSMYMCVLDLGYVYNMCVYLYLYLLQCNSRPHVYTSSFLTFYVFLFLFKLRRLDPITEGRT